MRVLLVGNVGDGYAIDMAAAADSRAIDLTTIGLDEDVHAAAQHARADVVVFDAGEELGLTARVAAAFAYEHPRTVVAVVATGVQEDRRNGRLFVGHRWRTPERLLDELTHAYVEGSRSRLESDVPFSHLNV